MPDARLRRLLSVLAVLAAVALVTVACGDSDDDAATETTTDAGDTTTAATEGGEGSCAVEDLSLHEAGTLTVATGEPAFPPWVVDDDPTNGQGFESAVVYAVAEELGITAENVVWVRSGFDEAVAPGDKPYDFNVQQYSITAERDEVVDFSDGYYTVDQALVAAPDSEIAGATSIAELESARLGAAIGTTSLDYIEEVIDPDTEAAVYDDNAAAKAAFDAGQVDGLVFDLPTAFFITAVEIPDAAIVGILPQVGDEPAELGFLFEDGSALVACVNDALARLADNGTLEAIEQEWLQSGGSTPTLSQ